MATLNGLNYARAYVTAPYGKWEVGGYNGESKFLYDEFTFAAEASIADIIRLGKLPKGARVIRATLKAPALGAGTFSLGHIGYAANADGTVPVKAAAPAGFIAATSFAAANQLDGVGVDIMFQFLAPTEIQATCTVATTAATGLKLQSAVIYSVE
jgi:hypothetical protein